MTPATVPTPCACTSIKKLSRVLGRVYDAGLAGSPMNVTQLAVLRCLARRKGEALLHVADELEMDRSSLYRALDPMVRERWVVIAPGIDERSKTAVITRQGHQTSQESGRAVGRSAKPSGGTFWAPRVGGLCRECRKTTSVCSSRPV